MILRQICTFLRSSIILLTLMALRDHTVDRVQTRVCRRWLLSYILRDLFKLHQCKQLNSFIYYFYSQWMVRLRTVLLTSTAMNTSLAKFKVLQFYVTQMFVCHSKLNNSFVCHNTCCTQTSYDACSTALKHTQTTQGKGHRTQ